MKPRFVMWAALFSLLVARGVVAAPLIVPSPLALPMAEPGAGKVAFAAAGECPGGGDESFPAVVGGRSSASGRYESLRYRPRRERGYRESGPRPESFSQLHLGFLDPQGPEASGVLVGFRGGLAVDPHIQIGGELDWSHRGDSQTAVISEGPGPGGTVITTRADLSRSSSDLVPLLGFVQVSASELRVIPYFGLGAGYEVLHLSAEDFVTRQEFKGTFGGFGWQAWGGVALPLSGRSRLNAEVFANNAELSRDVEDPSTGQTFRETVDRDGAGMRVGLAWGF